MGATNAVHTYAARRYHNRSRNSIVSERIPDAGLESQGIETRADLHWNLVTARLVDAAVRRGEGKLSADGPLVVETGQHTGRSAQDKFIVRDAETEDDRVVGQDQQGDDARAFRRAQGRFHGARCATRKTCTSRICSADRSPNIASTCAS